MKKIYDLTNIHELFQNVNPMDVEQLLRGLPEDEDSDGEGMNPEDGMYIMDEDYDEMSDEDAMADGLADGTPRTYKTIATTSLVTVVSYMLGMDDARMQEYYGAYNEELMEQLKANKEATIIRYLCRLRTTLMMKFKEVDDDIRYNLGNIDRMSFFNLDEIKALRKWGIEVVVTNSRADKYSELFNDLIARNIDACKGLFPEWVNFDYLKDFFVVAKYKKPGVLKEEFNKYHANINSYPFQMYMHWEPKEMGNILYCDGKFLQLLYEQHGDVFRDRSKYRDAVADTKQSIYDYIDHTNRVIIVVDCENSDVFKLHGVLKNLDEDEIAKIEKIVLYDDEHSSDGWDYLETFVKIPVEHVEVERVTDRKSLVDLRMTAGICQSYYRDNIHSFILCSSDSDFWGVISAIPEADFLVLYEYSKCGKDIKEALTLRNIYHCSMDDFYTGNAGEIKKVVLRKSLEREAKDIVGKNALDIAKRIYSDNHIEATETEIIKFYEKYVRTLRLKIDDEGCFYVEIA